MSRTGWTLLGALLIVGSGCRDRLLEGLDEPQANDLIVALAAHGIEGDKVGRMGRFAVEVSPGHFAEAWRIARSNGLPRPVHRVRRGWLGEPRAGSARLERTAEIERILRADPAIVDARVVLGAGGAAVSLRAVDPAAVRRARVAERLRTIAGLAPQQSVDLDVHPVTVTEVASPPPSDGRPGLWLASVAVGLMLAGCGLVWRRVRDGST